MIKCFLCVVIPVLTLLGSASVQAQDSAPLTYQNGSGGTSYPAIITGLNASNTPNVPNYRGLDNNWHAANVVVAICGLDSNSYPVACPTPLSKDEADKAYLSLNGGPMADGAAITSNNGSIHMARGVFDQSIDVFALVLGYGGRVSFTSQSGAYYMDMKLDNSGNFAFVPYQKGAGGVVIGEANYEDLPVTETSDGVLIFCLNCTYNGATGVLLHWSNGLAAWLTSDNVVASSKAISATVTGDLSVSGALRIGVTGSTITGTISTIGTQGVQLKNSAGNLMDMTLASLYSRWLIVWQSFTWATMPGSPPANGSAVCTDCTLTYNGTTTTNPLLRWNPSYGSSGGWDYEGRVLGVVLKHP